jgi:ABC-type oligopeptide transport system substrate-binding subunit
MEWGSFLEVVRRGDFTLARFGVTGEPDPLDFIGIMRTGDPNNIGGYGSTRFDDVVNRAAKTADRGERNRLLAQAEAMAYLLWVKKFAKALIGD